MRKDLKMNKEKLKGKMWKILSIFVALLLLSSVLIYLDLEINKPSFKEYGSSVILKDPEEHRSLNGVNSVYKGVNSSSHCSIHGHTYYLNSSLSGQLTSFALSSDGVNTLCFQGTYDKPIQFIEICAYNNSSIHNIIIRPSKFCYAKEVKDSVFSSTGNLNGPYYYSNAQMETIDNNTFILDIGIYCLERYDIIIKIESTPNLYNTYHVQEIPKYDVLFFLANLYNYPSREDYLNESANVKRTSLEDLTTHRFVNICPINPQVSFHCVRLISYLNPENNYEMYFQNGINLTPVYYLSSATLENSLIKGITIFPYLTYTLNGTKTELTVSNSIS